MTATRTDRKLALAVGASLAALLMIGAAVQVGFWTLGAKKSTIRRTLAGPVHSVTVDARGGDVQIVPARVRGVQVETDASGSFRVPVLRSTVDGDRVRVSGGCPDVSLGHCSARIVLRVPPTVAVQVTAASGDITVDGVSGAVDIRTRSGDVMADNLSGPVTLQSRSGDIEARGLRSSGVRARTTSGDVVLDFATEPRDVDAQTTSGDASIFVPPGAAGYRVEVHTTSGDPQVGVRTDDRATRVLRAHTRSGDAVVDYRG